MNAIRIRRKIESETLHLPELRNLIGKTVEIIVLEELPEDSAVARRRKELFARLPESEQKTLTPEEIAALLADSQCEKLWPIVQNYDPDALDVDAIVRGRTVAES